MSLPELAIAIADSIKTALADVSIELAAFLLLATIIYRKNLLLLVRRCAPDSLKVNFFCFALDAAIVAPLLALVFKLFKDWSTGLSSESAIQAAILALPTWATLFLVVFLGDFIGYLRHRLEHSRWFWPAHVMHHSDRTLNWFSLYRIHPLNRICTFIIDIGALLAIGFPVWAVIANSMIRHYYGLLIHARLPWTYGPLGWIFVSPAMHRWHHARNETLAGKNFSTIFSIFDWTFGTYYVPSPCQVPVGLEEEGHDSFIYQLVRPFNNPPKWLSRIPRSQREGVSNKGLTDDGKSVPL